MIRYCFYSRTLRIQLVSMDMNGAEFDMTFVPSGGVPPPSGGVHNIVSPLQFFTISPTRLFDTREANGGGAFKPGETRTYGLYNAAGVPSTAVSFAGGISALLGGTGFLTLWPASASQPLASSINFQTGLLVMGSVYTSVALNGNFRVFSNAGGHVILDITGYFAPAAAGGAWFNPVTPFRVFDTREMPDGPISAERAIPFRGVGAISQTALAVSFTTAMVDGKLLHTHAHSHILFII